MKLTPEQIAEGWIEWAGGERPIKDDRTVLQVLWSNGKEETASEWANPLYWLTGDALDLLAYRIIEAHGADAEPARPTPFPSDYSELVFDDSGWSQTIIVDGKRPEWLRDDDAVRRFGKGLEWEGRHELPDDLFAIRVRRREPKRETVKLYRLDGHAAVFTIDLIDGEPDLSSLKIAEDAL